MTMAIRTTSPVVERCNGGSHQASFTLMTIEPRQPYVLTWTGAAEDVQRWHPGCVPAVELHWLALPMGFMDTVRIGVEP